MKIMITFLQFILIVSTNIAQPTNGIVAHYPFNGDYQDYSGQGNDGSGINTTFMNDRFGETDKAVYFNGDDAYVTIPNSTSLSSPTEQLAISIWFYLEQANTIHNPFLTKSDDPNQSGQYMLNYQKYTGDSHIDLNFNHSAHNYAYTFSLQEWYHLVVSYDGSSIKYYVNSTYIGELGTTGNIEQSSLPLEFGRNVPGATEYYKGGLDDIRIYNRALTETEILELYHESDWQLDQGLVAYYPFNGNTNDESGNGNNPSSVNEITYVDGFINEAAQFTSTSYLEVPDNSSLDFSNASGVTIMAWIRQEQAEQGDIFRKMGEGYTEDDEYGLAVLQTGQISGAFNSPEQTYRVIESNSYLTFNEWNHIVFMWNKTDSSICIYINGILDNKINSPVASIQNTNVPLRIGHALQSYLPSFIGLIDDLRFYNRTLTESEILELYHEGGWGGNIAPMKPQNLVAIAGNGQVTLKWNQNTEADFLKYRIYMGTDSTILSLKDSSATSITDTIDFKLL